MIAPLNGDDYSRKLKPCNLISDSIIDIDGGGVDTCETKLIQTVEVQALLLFGKKVTEKFLSQM